MTDPEKPLLAKVRKPKDLVIRQAESVVTIPPLDPFETLQRELQQVTRQMTSCYLEAAEKYYEGYIKKIWEHFGYQDPDDYFEERIGVAYRTYMQSVLVWSAHLAITEGERPDARLALEGVGIYKAAVIAPVIKERPLEWAEWTKAAKDLNREALQEKVSKARGLPPAHSKKSEDRLYQTFVGRMDKDEREEFEETYRALKLITESDDFTVNTSIAYREGRTSWLATAERIRTGHGNA
jgi:hypothetical protein